MRGSLVRGIGVSPLANPDRPRTWRNVTQSCWAFQMRIGRQHKPATAIMHQKPRLHNSRRYSGVVSRNSAADGIQTIIVYLASMPRPSTRPSSGQAQFDPRKMARWPSTSAQPQQQVYGASMVISEEPTAMSGSVSASADHGQGQHLTAVHLHGEDVQAHQQQAAADDGRQTHGKSEIAGVLDGPGTGQRRSRRG